MTSPLMKFTLQDRDTLHELDQPLKELAYVSNHWGPLLHFTKRRPTASEVTAQGTRQSDKAKVDAANNQLIWVSETAK